MQMGIVFPYVCVLSLLCANGYSFPLCVCIESVMCKWCTLPIMCTSCVCVSEPYSLVFCPWIVSPVDSSTLACWAAVCALACWAAVCVVVWCYVLRK